MDPVLGVVLGVGLGVPLLLALIIGIIVLAGRPRPVEGLGPHTATWNAELIGAGLLDRTYGVLAVRDGLLWFSPDGAGAPAWSVPCRELVAQRQGFISRAAVQVSGPWGVVRCNVSREHINRISANDIKTLRERRYATEFLGTLAAAGARVLQ